jgi:starch synthase
MSASTPPAAAIRFEPDAYMLSGPRLMGRQSAGNAFLRAAVAGRQGQPLWAYADSRQKADQFRSLAQEVDPTAEVRWAPTNRLDLLAAIGTLYLPAPNLAEAARLRLRAGPAAYGVCGVTHTTASHGAMDQIAGMLTAPVMPWDALICTSQAVLATVQLVLTSEQATLQWRLGTRAAAPMPLLPVIPLGVHCDDFAISPDQRAAARAALGIAPDEVVALFVGRLSFHAKANPHPMYAGLQAAAQRSGRRLALVQCGWFHNAAIERVFRDAAARLCPDVRTLFTDGRDPARRQESWAAADMFLSLSDNLQETFGLTPVEAMAAGLPVLITDWDGYKDTVRDGVDGFRIATWMPPAELGEPVARSYEAGTDNYDMYCALTARTVSLDLAALVGRLNELVTNADLRRRLGEAGRRRARELFDWTAIYRQYQDLWAEMARRRTAAQADPVQQASLAAAPRTAATRMDPFRAFAHYPTGLIQAGTRVGLRTNPNQQSYVDCARDPLFDYPGAVLPEPATVDALLAALAPGACGMRDLAARTNLDLGVAILVVAILAKMGLVELAAGA